MSLFFVRDELKDFVVTGKGSEDVYEGVARDCRLAVFAYVYVLVSKKDASDFFIDVCEGIAVSSVCLL